MVKGLAICGVMVLVALSSVPGALAREQHFSTQPNGQISFMMPSGNIACLYTPRGGTDTYVPASSGPELSCDRIAPSYVNVVLGPDGPAVLTENPAEQSCCGGDNVFAYGNTARFDGFTCTSSTGGLTCETADGRHGFCVARARMLHY